MLGASVDHIVPRSVCPELDKEIANLELLPLEMNRQKKDQVDERQVSPAKKTPRCRLAQFCGSGESPACGTLGSVLRMAHVHLLPPVGVVHVQLCSVSLFALIYDDQEGRCVFHSVSGVKNVGIFKDYHGLA